MGLILALTGAGGGILAVPLLVFGLHLSIRQAAPVGLIAVGAASALGAALALREGLVRYRAAAVIGLAGMTCAPAGVQLARVLPNAPLTIAFAFILGWMAYRTLRSVGVETAANGPPPGDWPCIVGETDGRLVWTLPCFMSLAITGVVAGMLSGLLGVGGGFVIVPSLVRFTNVPVRGIFATSLAVIALVSTGGVAAAAWQGAIEWRIALPFTAGAVVALLAGRRLASHLAGDRLQQGFAVTTAAVAVLLFARGMGWLST